MSAGLCTQCASAVCSGREYGVQQYYFEAVAVLGTSAISTYLIRIFVFSSPLAKRRGQQDKKLIRRLGLFMYVVPLFPAAYIYAQQGFGYSTLWCWVECDLEYFPQGCVWRQTLFYYELYGVFLYNAATYIVVVVLLRRVNMGGERQEYNTRVARKLSLYLLAFVICWTAPCVNRLLQSTVPDFSNQYLDLAQAFTNPLMGFLDAVVYGSSSGAWGRWKRSKRGSKWPDDVVLRYSNRLRKNNQEPLEGVRTAPSASVHGPIPTHAWV
ncbi:hypothetical protein KIPB_002166 [Kipferlia bialata]|uniref:G-protein coupled receptors family 2 profile 2 domain-containing protein n=1 Tax=Kipferlia bialata TaxID=797122 RepID=A0A9K3GEQ9_9EUKA|nr:hypothetical protein KIPB_002166 [Kipferlia bialata]|eukprot:g2166.t1